MQYLESLLRLIQTRCSGLQIPQWIVAIGNFLSLCISATVHFGIRTTVNETIYHVALTRMQDLTTKVIDTL